MSTMVNKGRSNRVYCFILAVKGKCQILLPFYPAGSFEIVLRLLRNIERYFQLLLEVETPN